MGLINIYWSCDPLTPHSNGNYPHTVNGAPKDLFNRSLGFFKSIALVGLMRQVKHYSFTSSLLKLMKAY